MTSKVSESLHPLPRFSSRKFLLTLTAMMSFLLMFSTGICSEQGAITVVLASLGMYKFGNIAEHHLRFGALSPDE